LSFHCVGRCIGVTLLFDQTPCRSGFPSGVRGTFQAAVFFEAAVVDLGAGA
jgi:hypothetical protein